MSLDGATGQLDAVTPSRPRGGWLSRLGVRPGEEAVVRLLLAHSFFIGVPRVLTSTAAMALFLARFGSQDLPWVYLGAALAVPLAGLARLRLAGRLRLARLFSLDLTAVIVALLAFWLLMGRAPGAWIVFALPVWYEVEWVLLSLEFGGLGGSLLDLRQAKRLLGLIGAGELAASALAGLAVPLLLQHIATADLLLVSASAVALGLVLLRVIVRRHPLHEARGRSDGEATRFATLLRDRYVSLLFVLVALSSLGYFVVDNAFYGVARATLTGDETLAEFLGVFWAFVALLTLAVRTLVTGPVLTRLGLQAGLVALPACVAAGALLVILADGVPAAVFLVLPLTAATKLVDQVLRDSLDRSSVLVLYQPLSPRQRLGAQTAVEGIVGPAAGGLAGLVLLALVAGSHVRPVPLFAVAVALCAGSIAVALRLRRHYVAALLRAIAGGGRGSVGLDLRDASSVEVLWSGLFSPRPAEALFCLEALGQTSHPSYAAFLGDSLAHPSEQVRLDALRRIEELGPPAPLPAVRESATSDAVPAVRGAALRALAICGEGSDVDRVAAHADDADPAVRTGALTGLLRSGHVAAVLEAGRRLVALSESEAASDRALAAKLVGALGRPGFDRLLLTLLGDPDVGVRRVAIQAAGRVGSPRLWQRVADALSEPALRADAAAALVTGGDAVLGLVESRLVDAEGRGDRALQLRLLRLLAQIPGAAATSLLWVRARRARSGMDIALAALSARRWSATGRDVAVVRSAIRAEGAMAARALWAAEALGGQAGLGLLPRALEREVDVRRDRLLALASFLVAQAPMRRARAGLASPSRARRAQSVELIEDLLPRSLRNLCVPLIEETPRAERLARLGRVFPDPRLPPGELLRELIVDESWSPWTRACAVYAAAALPGGLGEAVTGMLASPDGLVREAAVWTLTRRRPDAGEHEGGERGGEAGVLSTIEKVMVLKTVSIFSETPDDVLAEVASLLEEQDVDAGEAVFRKGDLGTAMYVVVEGRVRVHDGERTLRELGERDIFGEMAALDPEPRSASVTALAPTRLFRLDQEDLYELMSDRIEVVRGVIRVLCRRLRATP